MSRTTTAKERSGVWVSGNDEDERSCVARAPKVKVSRNDIRVFLIMEGNFKKARVQY